MKLAMIPTAYRTIFFHAVSRELEGAGHEVFWLSPNSRWARWLVRQGVPVAKVLDVCLQGSTWADRGPLTSGDRERLQALDDSASLRVHNIIAMDPLLVRRPRERALKYLGACERLVREFLVSNDIRAVLGEQTWAFELLVGQVCLTLRIPHLVPHTIRIPDPRFAFFDGHLETNILSIRSPGSQDLTEARRHLDDFRNRRPRPAYMAVNRTVLTVRWPRLRTLARHVLDLASDPYDETSRRPLGLILDHSRQVLRGVVHRRSGRFSMPPWPPDRPFVFFPLHKQPEASIDIKGSPFTGQIEIIRALSRSLPLTHDLYVKEHAIALNTRPREFYRELQRIPGVRLISPFADSFQLIAEADLVVTITGTAAYEAALLGRPATTIAPVFFDRIVAERCFDPFQDSVARLLVGANRPRPKEKHELVEFLAWVLAQSFPGIAGDAFWQPDSMSDDNVRQVSEGFLSALSVLERSAATGP